MYVYIYIYIYILYTHVSVSRTELGHFGRERATCARSWARAASAGPPAGTLGDSGRPGPKLKGVIEPPGKPGIALYFSPNQPKRTPMGGGMSG